MCLATPLKLINMEADRATGTVEVNGGQLEVGLDLVPGVQIGDYVLIHAGMAIELLEDDDAEAILESIENYVHTDDQVVPGDSDTDES